MAVRLLWRMPARWPHQGSQRRSGLKQGRGHPSAVPSRPGSRKQRRTWLRPHGMCGLGRPHMPGKGLGLPRTFRAPGTYPDSWGGQDLGTFICSRPSELCFPQEKGNVAAGTQEAGKNVVLGLTDLQKPQESTLRKCLFCPHRNTEKWDLKPHRAKGCL